MGNMNNGAKLKRRRIQLNMSQSEFGRMVGLSASTICRLETDESRWAMMRDGTVDRIFNGFDTAKSEQEDVVSNTEQKKQTTFSERLSQSMADYESKKEK